MPKVLIINGFKFHFYSDEGNEPCHIHVSKGGANGKWWLEPTLIEEHAYGFTLKERKQIKSILEKYHQQLKDSWHEYFRK